MGWNFIQFSLVSSRWHLCARKSLYVLGYILSQKFHQRRLWNVSNVRLIDAGPLSSFQGRSSTASSFHAFLLQAIDGVVSLALCPQVVSQASQHCRSSRRSFCSVVSLNSGMSRLVHPQEFSKVDVDHRHIPVWYVLKYHKSCKPMARRTMTPSV